ncbi:MAG: 8-amino-7-oxononanoate synthase [Pseudomonadota bacterium]
MPPSAPVSPAPGPHSATVAPGHETPASSALPNDWASWLSAQRATLEHANQWRQRRTPADGAKDFASNDYLALARHPELAKALAAAAADLGCGAGSAQLLGGYRPIHQELEERLAEWVQRPAAALFSTGYMANLGLITALTGTDDLIVQDKLNHASLIDAARLSGAKLRRFRHHDMNSLQRQLTLPGRRRLLAVESVFSMDGDLAPLAEIARLATAHDALLCVDEAHALGVFGQHGSGSLGEAGLSAADAPVVVGTFGKSLGTHGAFVAGPQEIIDQLVNRARSHVYTTAPAPPLAAATLASLQLVRRDQWRRDHLQDLIERFVQRAGQLGLPLGASRSPIQPLLLGEAGRALDLSQALATQGFHVPAIRPPTVPEGTSRLRISLNAGHQPDDIEQLLVAIARHLEQPAQAAGLERRP